MADLLITIDGPAGSGKSTIARELAKRLCATYLDTGAMYRVVTFAAMEAGVDLKDSDKVLEVINGNEFTFAFSRDRMVVFLDGEEVTDELREPEVTENVKYIASSPKLRARLVEMQRDFAIPKHKIITEGRDQGTVAFPDAHVKFFLTAEVHERARRRHAELVEAGHKGELEQTLDDIEKRDESDVGREVGPLKPADDAITVDTTNMSVNEVVATLLNWVEKKCFGE